MKGVTTRPKKAESLLPKKVTLCIYLSKVNPKTPLLCRPGHFQHPGGRVNPLLNPGDSIQGLEIADKILGVVPSGAAIDHSATRLQKDQLIKRLHC